MTLDQLLRSGKPITVLLECESSAGMHYLSNTGYISGIADTVAPNRPYPDWLKGVPEIREELPEGLFGRSTIGWSECIISNPNGKRDSWLTEAWDGYPSRMLVGARDWDLADFHPVFNGVSTGLQATGEGDLRLTVSDPTELLNGPVQSTLLTTGPSTGEPAPICYGSVFNVEPPCVDAPNHRYQVNDGAVTTTSDVRVGGLTVSKTNNNAGGKFDTNVLPDGRVTADVTAPLSRADQLLVALAARRSVASVDAAAMAALAIAAPQALGLWSKDRENAIDLMDDVASSVGAWWRFDELGQLTAAVAGIGAPVMTLTPDDIDRNGVTLDEVILPTWRQRLGYRKNWSVQTDGLFGAVTETNRQRYGREYDVVEDSDATIKTVHKLARDPEMAGTLLVDAGQASTEVARRQDLFGVVRRIYTIKAKSRAWPLRSGNTVRVVYNRFGLNAGVDFLVIRSSRRIDSRSTELRVWG